MDVFKRRGAKYSRITYRLPRERLDEDVALLLGLHVGDGWLSDKWGIMCEKVEGSMIRWIIRLAREVLGVEPIRRFCAACLVRMVVSVFRIAEVLALKFRLRARS